MPATVTGGPGSPHTAAIAVRAGRMPPSLPRTPNVASCTRSASPPYAANSNGRSTLR